MWAVLDGDGEVRVGGEALAVTGPGAYRLIAHPHSTTAALDLRVGDGVECFAVCFAAGLPAP